MRSRICFSAIVVLVAWRGLAEQEQPRTPVATPPLQHAASAPAYRLLQLVSASNTEQAINDAAAAGYRFVMLQPTAGASGVTVLMKGMEAGTAPYQYRLVLAEPGKENLQHDLNQAGGAGFRLVAESVLIAPFQPRGNELLLCPWPPPGPRSLSPFGGDKKPKPMIYVAVMERAPGTSATFDYRVSSAIRQSSVQKDLLEIAGQGFIPIATTLEPSRDFLSRGLASFVLVFEKNTRDVTPVPEPGQYVYLKFGKFLSSGDPLTELSEDVSGAATSETKNAEVRDTESTEERNTVQTPEGVVSEEAPWKPELRAAAITGSRMLVMTRLVVDGSIWVLAKKHPESPSPSYRLVLRTDPSRLEEALNNAAVEGFRLFHGGVVDTTSRFELMRGEVRDKKHRQLLAVLQRETATPRYQYRILHDDDAVVLLKQMNEASASGYEFAYMFGSNVIMEKGSRDSAGEKGSL